MIYNIPLARTFVVIKTFSSPSLNLSSTEILSLTVRSPDKIATACPSFVIFDANQFAVFLVYNVLFYIFKLIYVLNKIIINYACEILT
jgi:hypothetical protein